MSGLSPDDQRLVDLARDSHEPTESDRARVRAVLLAGLGAGAGLGVTASATSAVGATAVVKVLAAIAVAGAIGGGGYVAYRAANAPQGVATTRLAATPLRTPEAPTEAATNAPNALATAPSQAAPMALPREPVAPIETRAPRPAERALAAPSQARLATATSEAATNVAAATSAVTASEIATTSVVTATNMAAEPPHPTESASGAVPGHDEERTMPPRLRTSVEDEMRLVRAGVTALDVGDASRALALFDEHARTYPRGVLAEERAGERVMALCALHRTQDARGAASTFLRDFRASPLAARIRTSCAAESVTDGDGHQH